LLSPWSADLRFDGRQQLRYARPFWKRLRRQVPEQISFATFKRHELSCQISSATLSSSLQNLTGSWFSTNPRNRRVLPLLREVRVQQIVIFSVASLFSQIWVQTADLISRQTFGTWVHGFCTPPSVLKFSWDTSISSQISLLYTICAFLSHLGCWRFHRREIREEICIKKLQ
jgi:hypothetical protein